MWSLAVVSVAGRDTANTSKPQGVKTEPERREIKDSFRTKICVCVWGGGGGGGETERETERDRQTDRLSERRRQTQSLETD